MNNTSFSCMYFDVSIPKENVSLTHAFAILLIMLSMILNIVAAIGTWKLNKACSSRTTKLLCYQFMVFSLLTVDIILFYAYPYINEDIRHFFDSFHVPSILFFVLLASCNQVVIAIDRYLLIRRGTHYRHWKNTFVGINVSVTISCFCISLYSGYIVFKKSCHGVSLILIMQGCVIIACSILSVCYNVSMILFLKKNLTLLEFQKSTLKRKIALTMITITIVTVLCEVVHLSFSYALSVSSSTSFKVYSCFCGLIMTSLFKCIFYPFIYIARNYDIARNVF